MKIYSTREESCWWTEPETKQDQLTSGIDSLSGPWWNEKAAKLAAQGKFALAHAAEGTG